jgi:hypothetical protein
MAETSKYVGQYQVYRCLHCQAENLIFDDWDGVDITSGEDTTAISCWNCKKCSFVVDPDELMLGDDPESTDGLKEGESPKQALEDAIKRSGT